MPTLPGRATSILAVLGGFSPVGRRSPHEFTWPAMVAEARPGEGTEAQREQARRLVRVQEDLRVWLESQRLPDDHLEESSFYAIVSLPPQLADQAVACVARTIAWIYAIDDFVDKDYAPTAVMRPQSAFASSSGGASGAETGTPRGRSALDTSAQQDSLSAGLSQALATIFAPLAVMAPRALARAPWSQPPRRKQLLPASSCLVSSRMEALREALKTLFADLTACWGARPATREQHRYRLQLAAEQMIACVAMMWREREWTAALAQQPLSAELPSLHAYLEVGSVSIGMPAVASVVAGFEARPRQSWRSVAATVQAAGSIVRLTNDLNTYEADVDEGKVSAVTVRLRDLGYAPLGHDPATSQEVLRAQARVAGDVAVALARFARLQRVLRDGPLGYYLRHSVAFALAVYGDGARFQAPKGAAS